MSTLIDIKPNIIMMGSDLTALGGVSEVVREYLKAGLDEKVNLVLVPSHIDGSKLEKLSKMIQAVQVFLFLPWGGKFIVHLHLSHGASFFRKLLLMVIAKIKCQKVIIHLHGSDYEEFMYQSKFHTILTKWVFDKSDHILVLSKRWENLLRNFTNNQCISTLYNPATKLNEMHCPQGNLKVLFLGRLGERKGVYDLLDAIKCDKIYYEERQITFILAGDGETDKVLKRVEEYGLEKIVVVPGWVSGAEKVSYLNNSHIFVLPSYNEQMPMSILEAMANGCPILATDIAGIPEMVEQGENGFLFSPGDLKAFEELLKILCENAKLREKMGLKSKQIIHDKFDGQLITDKLVEVYRYVINGS